MKENKFYWKSVTELILKAKVKSIKFAINHPIEYYKAIKELYINN